MQDWMLEIQVLIEGWKADFSSVRLEWYGCVLYANPKITHMGSQGT